MGIQSSSEPAHDIHTALSSKVNPLQCCHAPTCGCVHALPGSVQLAWTVGMGTHGDLSHYNQTMQDKMRC